jgi:peptidyl-prolyl cis-trans isomerase C
MTSIVALRAPVALRAAAATRKQRAPLAAKITAAAKPTVKAPMVVKSKSSVARLASAATFLGSAQAAFASEVAQLAEGDDLIPTLAIFASLAAVLWSSQGAIKGILAVLVGGEEATASHILVKDPSLAQSLLERLQDGPQDNLEDRFAREAGNYSECPSKSKGGSLGTFKPGQMVKEFNDAVFNGPVGVIQGPVKTQFGYHLILVTDRVEPEKK